MKIFLAGTYSSIKDKDVLAESPFVLESFYYIKPWQIQDINRHKMFLLDSGAFTFMVGNGRKEDFNSYLKRYIDFINKYDIKYFFELDVDVIIGYEEVLKLRKRLEGETGKKCIPVWHKNRGKEEFIKMCDEYDFVAYGGLVSDKKSANVEMKYFPWFIKTAHEHGAMIHGLGFTRVSDLPKYHFDSVDSTRWNCARFGRLEYFDGKTIRSIDRRKEGKRIIKTGEIDSTTFNLKEWIKFQKYAETHL